MGQRMVRKTKESYRILKPKSVIVYSNILYTFAFVNDIKKWNKAVRSFVVKTVSNV